jgi:tripartite-type tricarboxylate transporter receptor subunit TctC
MISPIARTACAALALTAPLIAAAQEAANYPARPIRWVLGFAPGGSPDSVARIITPQLTAQLGQSVVLDNRPGANGILAADIVAKSAPDGYTLLITSAAFSINPSIARKLPFDAVKSFAPVTNLASSEALLLTVAPTVTANTVQELITLAKRPGAKFAYGSSGVGNVTHLAAALFAARTGTDLIHVPYKGGGPVTVALISGEIQIAIANPGTLIGAVKAGRIRALAYNAPQRTPLLPNVPTMIEAGVKGMELDASWRVRPGENPRGYRIEAARRNPQGARSRHRARWPRRHRHGAGGQHPGGIRQVCRSVDQAVCGVGKARGDTAGVVCCHGRWRDGKSARHRLRVKMAIPDKAAASVWQNARDKSPCKSTPPRALQARASTPR